MRNLMKSLWGHIWARSEPYRHRVLIKVFHPDSFSRVVSADELPRRQDHPVTCLEDFKNESLAVLELILVAKISNTDAAGMLRQLAEMLEKSPSPFTEWSRKRFCFSRKQFVDKNDLHLEWQEEI
jgi:hypothetical protein